MAELDQEGRNTARRAADVRLMPGEGEAPALDITTSQPFECSPGETWTISVTEDAHIAANADATASSTPLPKGVHDFTIPTGVTRFELFSAETGALGAAWKS